MTDSSSKGSTFPDLIDKHFCAFVFLILLVLALICSVYFTGGKISREGIEGYGEKRSDTVTLQKDALTQGYSKPEKTADHTSSNTGNNSGIIGGINSKADNRIYNINGNNNGIVGDYYSNTEPTLTSAEKEYIKTEISHWETERKFKFKTFMVCPAPSTASRKTAEQIVTFLEESGLENFLGGDNLVSMCNIKTRPIFIEPSDSTILIVVSKRWMTTTTEGD